MAFTAIRMDIALPKAAAAKIIRAFLDERNADAPKD